VFGNGMLQSPHIRFAGAFNHQHVFVDPSPDPERSFAERRRLFAIRGSSWADYDPGALSPGGGIFDRQAKAVRPSAEIRELLGLDQPEITPNDLIRALLAAEVDLLWFGGIGTFVKSREESNFDVGDGPNDGVRIDAHELRAQVVAEGANLGMTQLARIHYARTGGRINTDAVDNCAGVACSDREVNIKILLGELERSGDLTRKQRNELLSGMTAEVAELVLRINYLQTQTLSVTHQLGAHLLDRLARVMRSFEKQRSLDRRLEFLPDDEELEERLNRREGFTRPELAVLLAYAKNDLCARLVRSALTEDPQLDPDVLEYFPAPLRERFGGRIARHPLRRELAATIVGNEMLDRGGVAFVHEVQEKTGATVPQIARAYIASREVLELRSLWREIEGLDHRVAWQAQSGMLLECGRALERATVWLLREEGSHLDVGSIVVGYRSGVGELREGIEDLISAETATWLGERVAALGEDGVPEPLARRVAALPLLGPAWELVRSARSMSLPLPPVARLFFEAGRRFGFDWLRRAAAQLPADNAWDKLAVSALLDDLLAHQSELVGAVVEGASGNLEQALERWMATNQPAVARTDQLLGELQSLGSPDLSRLAVANRQLKLLSRWGRTNDVTAESLVGADR
jgi:glutamate dehydrogenase